MSHPFTLHTPSHKLLYTYVYYVTHHTPSQFDETMIVYDACRLIRERVPDAASGQRMCYHSNRHFVTITYINNICLLQTTKQMFRRVITILQHKFTVK